MTYVPEPLRAQIRNLASERCEYCLLHEDHTYYTHEIDHIFAEKHGGATTAINLCLACIDCNRHKGSDICSLDPVTDTVSALYHPRQEKWDVHFSLLRSGLIEPQTIIGRVTERILRFNRVELVSDRKSLIDLGFYDNFTAER